MSASPESFVAHASGDDRHPLKPASRAVDSRSGRRSLLWRKPISRILSISSFLQQQRERSVIEGRIARLQDKSGPQAPAQVLRSLHYPGLAASTERTNPGASASQRSSWSLTYTIGISATRAAAMTSTIAGTLLLERCKEVVPVLVIEVVEDVDDEQAVLKAGANSPDVPKGNDLDPFGMPNVGSS